MFQVSNMFGFGAPESVVDLAPVQSSLRTLGATICSFVPKNGSKVIYCVGTFVVVRKAYDTYRWVRSFFVTVEQPATTHALVPIALGAAAGYFLAGQFVPCVDCGHTCMSNTTGGLCMQCAAGCDICEECLETPTDTKKKKRRRGRNESSVTDFADDFADSWKLITPLAMLCGIRAFRDAKIFGEALSGISNMIDSVSGGNYGQRMAARFMAMTSDDAADATASTSGPVVCRDRAGCLAQNQLGGPPCVCRPLAGRPVARKRWWDRFRISGQGNKLAFGTAALGLGALMFRWNIRRKLTRCKNALVDHYHSFKSPQDSEAKIPSSILVENFQRVAMSSRTITTEDGISGTAFRAGSNYWLTARHVIERGSASIQDKGVEIPLKVEKVFPHGNDGITVLKQISSNQALPSPPIGSLRIETPGFVIGCINGMAKLSIGNIDPKGRHLCSTHYGHSGGPVCTNNGVVVGVHITGEEDHNGWIPFNESILSFLRAQQPVKSSKSAQVAITKESLQMCSESQSLQTPAPRLSSSSGLHEDFINGLSLMADSPPRSLQSSIGNQHSKPSKKRKRKRGGGQSAEPSISFGTPQSSVVVPS